MKKRVFSMGIVVLLLVLPLAMAFATAADPDPEGPIEVMFWNKSRHDLVMLEDQIERFNAANPDINVTLEQHVESIREELTLAFEAENAPDLYAGLSGGMRRQFAQLGWAADLMPMMSDAMIERYDGWFLKQRNMYPGPDGDYKLITYPNGMGTTYRLLYNKDLFAAAGLDPESPPASWQELVDAADAITEYGASQDPKKFGIIWPGLEYDAWEYWMEIPATASGMYWYDYDKVEFNYSQFLPILDAYRQMVEDGSVFPDVLNLSWDPPKAQFAAGNVGLYFGASWDIGVFVDQFPAQIDWGVAQFPTLTGERVGMTQASGGTGGLYVNGQSDPEVQQAAVKFMEFIYSLEEQVAYAEAGLGIPLKADIVAAVTPPSSPKQVVGFFGLDDVVFPLWPPSVALEGESKGDVYNNIVFGRVDGAEALADLDKRMNEALKAAVDAGDVDLSLYRIPGWAVPASTQ